MLRDGGTQFTQGRLLKVESTSDSMDSFTRSVVLNTYIRKNFMPANYDHQLLAVNHAK